MVQADYGTSRLWYKQTMVQADYGTSSIKSYFLIDLGMKNLFSIYDSDGKQKLIKGVYINSINNYFNKQLNYWKSKCKSKYKTSKRIRNLWIKMENLIDRYFNILVKWVDNNYKHKTKLIIGYNKLWKQKVNMGRRNNQKKTNDPLNIMI